MFVGAGDAGIWDGTPIVDHAFSYQLGAALDFTGAFAGVQSAAGTLRFFNSAVAGVRPACDSGTIAWTATTDAVALPPGTLPSPPPASPPAVPHARPGVMRAYGTTILLRARLGRTLDGRVTSRGPGCTAGRTVVLKRGALTLKSTKTHADGTFAFKRTTAMRGRKVLAMVLARQRPTLICAGGASRRVQIPKR